MLINLRCGGTTAAIETKGAEIRSLKSADGTEYMWCRDAKYWNRCSPILFPSIGVVKNGIATFDGVDYPMPKHGLVRDAEFFTEALTDEGVTLTYESNEETKKSFPFDFELSITYLLFDGCLNVAWRVDNMDSKEMPFLIGGHPAFNIPLAEGETAEDYDFRFDTVSDFVSMRLNAAGELREDTLTVAENTDTIPFDYSLFDDDALMFKDFDYTSISLESRKSKRGVRVGIAGVPYVGIWSPGKAHAPFVCIEPWFGINSKTTDSTVFADKEGVNILPVGESFDADYTISIY